MADDNGEPSDDLVPAILDTAHQYNIQVSPQEEIKCSLAYSGDFPSSATGIVPLLKFLALAQVWQIHSKCGVGGGVLINSAYITHIVFNSEKKKVQKTKNKRNGRLNITII